MCTDYLSARARWLISQQQRRKRKRQKSDLSILHKGSCVHDPQHSAEETGCDIRHFPFVQMHSFHQIKLRWSCSLYNTDCCVGLRTLPWLSLLTVKLQLKGFSVADWKSKISRKVLFQRCYISHSEVRYWRCQRVTQTDMLSVEQPCVGGTAFPKLLTVDLLTRSQGRAD